MLEGLCCGMDFDFDFAADDVVVAVVDDDVVAYYLNYGYCFHFHGSSYYFFWNYRI